MKVVKNYLKVAICFIAFALISVLFAFSPVMTSFASNSAGTVSAYINSFSAIQIPKKIDYKNDTLVIPTLDKSGYTIRLIDPAGHFHDYSEGYTGTYFEPVYGDVTNPTKVTGITTTDLQNTIKDGERLTSQYKVVYFKNLGTNESPNYIYSNVYKFDVINASYTISIEAVSGLNTLIPAEVDIVSTIGSFDDLIELPAATVKDAEGVEVRKVAPTVNGKTAKAVDSVSDILATDLFVSNAGKYYAIPRTNGSKLIVRYEYVNGTTIDPITIKVTEDFVKPTTIKTNIAKVTFPSIELGDKEVELPKLVVNNEYNDNIDYNITKIVIRKKNNHAIYTELVNNDRVFDMVLATTAGDAKTGFVGATKYSELSGDYEIAYTIQDAYKNEPFTTNFADLGNIKISKATRSKLYMTYNYTDAANVDKTFDTEFRETYNKDSIILPAVYVEDKTATDIKVVRTIRADGKIYYVDNYKIKVGDADVSDLATGETGNAAITGRGDSSQAVQFKFEDGVDCAGSYTLYYTAYAKNDEGEYEEIGELKKSDNNRYTFTVIDTVDEASTPEITISNLTNDLTFNDGDEVVVKTESDDDKDDYLKKFVFTYTGSSVDKPTLINNINSAITTALTQLTSASATHKLEDYNLVGNTHIVNTVEFKEALFEQLGLVEGTDKIIFADAEENNKNNFRFTVNKNTNIVALAVNYYGQIDVDTREIAINNIREDDAPEYELKADENDIYTLAGQTNTDVMLQDKTIYMNDTVDLPTVEFNDTEDSSLELSVAYYIDEPDLTSAKEYLSTINPDIFGSTIDGGSIKTSKAGNYNVIYTATDDAGNSTVLYFTFAVLDNSKPILKVTPTSVDSELNIVGNTITAEQGAIINFETIMKSTLGEKYNSNEFTSRIKIESDGLAWKTSSISANSRQFIDAGQYTVTISGERTITGLEDDAEPVVLYVNIEEEDLEWSEEINIVEGVSKDALVELPIVSTNNGAQVKVKVEYKGEEVELDIKNSKGIYATFVAENEGVYTVTYTATRYNTITETFNIKVGDTTDPILTMEHAEDLAKDIVFDGETDIEYTLDINKSNKTLKIVINNGKETLTYDTELVITDADDEGNPNSVSWNSSRFSVELTNDAGKAVASKDGNQNIKLISSTGTYVLKISYADETGNKVERKINFKVVSENTRENINDTVVGIVLIVVSLIVLAGVIAFFSFSGKKPGKTKSKTLKTKTEKVEKVEKVEEVKEEVEEEAKVEAEEENSAEIKAEPVEETEVETSAEEEVSEETENNDGDENIVIEEDKSENNDNENA